MLQTYWALLRDSIVAFIDDEALSRGAAMAFYAVTSLAPILLIVIAIAGLVFGHDAAQNAIVEQLSGLMGQSSAELLQNAIKSASDSTAGTIGTIIGIVTLIITASGVFGEMQTALNAIWKVEASGATLSRLVRARIASVGLVAALGFLLIISLVMSAVITAVGGVITGYLLFGKILISIINTVVSFALLAVLFGAIYKVLPDRKLEWQDVIVGACITAALFTIGKSLIGWYLGSSAVASAYGAAGSLLIVLLWVYYSSEIFLLGAEFTHQWWLRRQPVSDAAAAGTPSPRHAPEPSADAEPVHRHDVPARKQQSPALKAISFAFVLVHLIKELKVAKGTRRFG